MEERRRSDGQPYYFNAVTGERSCKRPQPLSRGWRTAKDSTTGNIYFYHQKTRAVVWERPDDAAAHQAPVQPEASAVAIDAQLEDSEADVVHGVPPAPALAKGVGVGSVRGSAASSAGSSSVRRVMSFGRKPRDVKEGTAPGAGPSATHAASEGGYSWDKRRRNVSDLKSLPPAEAASPTSFDERYH